MPFETRTRVLAYCTPCRRHLTHDDTDTPIAYTDDAEATAAFTRHATQARHPAAGLRHEPRLLHRAVCDTCGRSYSDDVEFIDQWWETTQAALDYLREFDWTHDRGRLDCGRAHNPATNVAC